MTTTHSIVTIDSITLEVPDTAAAEAFYDAAFGLTTETIGLRPADAASPSSGFRGFTLSLVVSQPSTVDDLVRTALEAGATALKPVKKSMWGYGGVVCAPDGTIWKVATSSKKDKGPANRQIDDVALLFGVADVLATKRFYVEHGLQVDKSFGRKYVQFAAPTGASGGITLGLYGRAALAKDAGVPPEGDGPHCIAIHSTVGPLVDPDGFVWESV